MPVKRRLLKGTLHRITPAAVEAFQAGDYTALHLALGLRPWETSPLPVSVTALGVDQDAPPHWMTTEHHNADWRQAQGLQRALIAATQTESP